MSKEGRGGALDAIRKQIIANASGSKQNRKWYIDLSLLADAGPDGKDIKVYRSKQGNNFLKILPSRDPAEYFGLEIFIHRDIGVNGDAFLCPGQMQRTSCPVCEEYKVQKQQSADPDFLRSLSSFPPRWLFWVVDMTDESTMALGAQLYEAPMTVNDAILAQSQDPRTGEIIDISDPNNRCNLVFKRTGERRNTRYTSFKIEDDGGKWDNSWLEYPTFDQLLIMPSYEEIAESFDTSPKPAEDTEGRGREARGPLPTGRGESLSRSRLVIQRDPDTEVDDPTAGEQRASRGGAFRRDGEGEGRGNSSVPATSRFPARGRVVEPDTEAGSAEGDEEVQDNAKPEAPSRVADQIRRRLKGEDE